MHLRYNYRLYPTSGQREILARTFGCARVVYNDFIQAKDEAENAGARISDTEAQRRVITLAKKTPERGWLSEVSSVALIQSCQDARTAYKNWFDSIHGIRKGKGVEHPVPKTRKGNRQAVRFTKNGFILRPNGALYLAKVGELKVAWSRDLPSAPSSVTIIRESNGRYFASFVVEVDPEPLPTVDSEVGIDLGLTTFAVLSNGKTVSSPKFYRRAERKLRKAQKSLHRKKKGSKNRAKARVRVAKAHAKVADTRRDWAHKQSTAIIRENQAVFVEDLCVAGLAKTRLAKSVHDAGWGMFTRMLEYKAELYGREFSKVDRFFPSSQTCSTCGVVDGKKPLPVREWQCKQCGTIHDRDLNAAKNILAAGLAERQNACGEAIRLPA